MKKIAYTAITTLTLTSIAGAATLITATGITGHHQGDSATGNGSILTTINQAGIDQVGGADSPATWEHDNNWATDWQGSAVAGVNAKIGWAVIDFGSAQTLLGDMLLWNVNEGSNPNRGMQDFNIYYSLTPTVSAPGVSGTATDYDFASGGWTQLGGTQTLAQAPGYLPGDVANPSGVNGTYDLSAIASAQYIGIEMLSDYGAAQSKPGFAEVVFTAVPEPSSAALLGLGGLALILRRRK